MAWIESNQELGRHPKMKKLARLLSISWPEAVGYLHYLWWWALDFAQDGDLSKYEAGDIADAVMWKGDPEEFVNALLEAGFLDANEDGGLEIHDWYDYAGKLLEQRKVQAEYRQRQYSLYNDLRLTRAVKLRDGDICQYCGKTVNWKDRRGPDGGTYDHVDPYGENTIDNIVVSCRSCNSKKGKRTPEEAGMPLITGGYSVDNSKNRQISGRNTVDNSVITVPNLTVPNNTVPNDIDDDKSSNSPPPVPYEKIRELFNLTCPSFAKVLGINGKRKIAVAARWKEHPDLDFFKEYFERVEASDFLKGKNDRNWKATFDWLMNAANMDKVREGKYGGDRGGKRHGIGVDKKHSGKDDGNFTLSGGFKLATEDESSTEDES